ncbi:uncharacterized protein LY79DRAFT_585291 [Colletotrichum navitas]|uniref:Uncharacterized protein n=1 Tax=Colletotrichum navitas TaxID=681940 RepID=A0AAD8PJT6_9PEZI|nr:uncharacterized protein LY79DRAFT_585291 [Colletotrichum navitas]KAK1564155.1 hypothetical protein LY79DRAFT_585291 [Colletotrichum navitas]
MSFPDSIRYRGLDKLLDPGQKDAILRFLSALQQFVNIITEPEELLILVALGFTGFEQVVPYIDLVNKVIKSALRYLPSDNNNLENNGMEILAYNVNQVPLSANKAALLSNVANIDNALSNSLIIYKVAPLSVFPYDHS